MATAMALSGPAASRIFLRALRIAFLLLVPLERDVLSCSMLVCTCSSSEFRILPRAKRLSIAALSLVRFHFLKDVGCYAL